MSDIQDWPIRVSAGIKMFKSSQATSGVHTFWIDVYARNTFFVASTLPSLRILKIPTWQSSTYVVNPIAETPQYHGPIKKPSLTVHRHLHGNVRHLAVAARIQRRHINSVADTGR